MPVTRTALVVAVPPASRTTEPVLACMSCAVVGASSDLIRPYGHPPGREHDHRPLAAHRGVGEALDRDVPGLRPADAGVVDAGHIPVGRYRPEHAARRPRILAVVAEERGQLPGLPEPFGMAGRIGDTGREGEGRQHPEHPGDGADQGRPDRHRGPPAAGLEREPCSHDQGHREVRGGRRRRDRGPAMGRRPAPGRQRGRRRGRRAGQHQERDQDPSRAQDQPVQADPGVRLGDRRHADRHPPRGHGGTRHAQRAAGQPGQEGPGRGGRDGLRAGHADGLQHLEVRHGGGDVPGDGLADQEQGRGERGEAEGQQAGRLVGGDPADGVAELLAVVPHVDVMPPGHPGQGGAEGGNGGLAALEPDQRVDIGMPVSAHHVCAVPGEQGGRRGDAAGRPRGVCVRAHGLRTSPTMRTRISGPRGGPVDPS